VDLRDTDGNSPLFIAVSRNLSTTALTPLLERTADINLPQEHGKTLLHVAAAGRSPEVVQLLLERQADVNRKDSRGNTPLHIAAQFQGVQEVIRLLLTFGADLTLQNDDGNTALLLACEYGHMAAVQLILKELRRRSTLSSAFNASNKAGRTPISFALEDEALLELLFEYGVDINARNDQGNTALHLAAFHSHLDTVRLLLQRGALSLPNADGLTPAALATSTEIVRLLQSQ
jgi:ankyrin repeat protein